MEITPTTDQTPNQISDYVQDVLSGIYYRESLRQEAARELRKRAAATTSEDQREMWLQQARDLEAVYDDLPPELLFRSQP